MESVFSQFGQKARSKKCPAIVGLLTEADEMASENKGSPAIDAALIAAAQRVEHYEIATYGSLHEWAALLGEDAAADILAEILEEEKAADGTLSELARGHCNAAANVHAYSHGCRTPILIPVGRRSNFCRTPFRFISDSVPG